MSQNNDLVNEKNEYTSIHRSIIESDVVKPINKILPIIVFSLILVILFVYAYMHRKKVVSDVEQVTDEMAEYIANNVSNEIDFGLSSIRLSAISISKTMTSDVLENPKELIMPMLDNTPFGGIEYIRGDGMNVMNIGEPFDASDRVYYIEGIKGNTGIWNNYHPKTSKETLINFYTPLYYEDVISGVITGYIQASSQVSPLFETDLYGSEIYGFLLDENDTVICSTIEAEYEGELSLDKLLDRHNLTEQQSQKIHKIIDESSKKSVAFMDADGEGRICSVEIPDINWKAVVVVPGTSFTTIINEHTRDAVIVIIVISLILVFYALFIELSGARRRKEIASKNAELEEKNKEAFSEISEIRDIIASANMGTWRIELVEGNEPRMYVDDTMKQLLGISGVERTPEDTYTDWFEHVCPEAVDSVLHSVERMEQGYFDENTYLWMHPKKGVRYVRCGGTAQEIPGGFSLRGYHYDVDDVVREDQAKMVMLREALDEKNEYYSTLGTLGDIFYSMHVIDLKNDTATAFNAKDSVKEIVNHKNGAGRMMSTVMKAVTDEKYVDEALAFTDLSTLAERMGDKKIISKQFVGKHVGWFLASFIKMEDDEDNKLKKVIYTTRVIDSEKKQEEKLILKSQTDELTGLLNRRSYEEDLLEQNDVPGVEDFTYVSLDVNGLKIVNDSLGHTAGDELIVGACKCMKDSLGPFGKIYRVGGDEFVAILFCSPDKSQEVLTGFDEKVAGWSGKLVESLSISYGWINKNEQPGFSIRQLGAIAEQRMYASKSEHYKKMGVDRRGQQDAHKALCELYTKILKINITDDSYQIINMNQNEQTESMGFSEKISEWLYSFGTSGQVHSEDLSEYLRITDLSYMKEYFLNNKTSLHLFYRRKYGDGFKQVMMEIIPANDYSENDMSLFLYVKDIDK